jgi:hypothetical protein
VLLVLLRPGFVGCSCVALFLDDSCGVIKRSTRDKTLLSSSSLNVENKTVCRKLLSTFDSQNVSWLAVRPGDGQEAFDLASYHQIVNLVIVDLVCDFPLPQLESKVPHAHEPEVYRKRDNWERYLDLVVLLRLQYQEEENDGQDVFEVDGGVDDEVPESKATLVSVGKDLVGVLNLV